MPACKKESEYRGALNSGVDAEWRAVCVGNTVLSEILGQFYV